MDQNLDPAYNYPGGVFFWSYIAAALVFTTLTLQSILQLPGCQQKYAICRNLSSSSAIFACLAGLSFTTLSVNMLHVLVQSYNTWLSTSLVFASTELGSALLARIWIWSMTSSLFLDFGEAIVAKPARYVWTLSALFATLSVSVYMGVEGKKRQIPRLWAFFALSQILPISFTLNLFYLALIRQEASAAVPIKSHKATLLATLAPYAVLLALAPRTAGTRWLMPIILTARILLLLPLPLIRQTSDQTGDSDELHSLQKPLFLVATALISRQIFSALHQSTWADIGTALFSHPAVTSLGMDFVLCGVSFAPWIFLQSHREAKPSKNEKIM